MPINKLPHRPNAAGKNKWNVKALWTAKSHLLQMCFMWSFILAASGDDDSLIPRDDLWELTDLDRASFAQGRHLFLWKGERQKDR